MSDSATPHQASLSSPTPGIHPNSCPSSLWWHPTISPSVVPFSSCLQSFPASGSFPMSQLFTWGGHGIGVLALASFLPKNTEDWSPLEWTGWISLQSKGLSRVFSNTTVQKHPFLALSFLYSPALTSIHDHWRYTCFPGGTSDKEPACQCRRCKRHGFDLQVRKIPWRREWQPTPVVLPGESHRQRSLVGYSR